MIHIPAGPFRYGMTEEQKRAVAEAADVHADMLHFHSSAETLTTRDFWIDRHPVTRGQFLQFMENSGYEIEYSGWLVGWAELTRWAALDDPARTNMPMTGVNSEDARAYAEWAGKRLPTEIEWEKAARGADGRLYPWGDDWREEVRAQGAPPLDVAAPVGSASDLASPYGVEEMAGGILEWVRVERPAVSTDGQHRDAADYVLAGSSPFHRQPYSHMVTSRWSWSPLLRAYNTGFRCVAAEPPDGDSESATATATGGEFAAAGIAIQETRYQTESIRLFGYDRPTFAIEVPWFPHSLWVVDVPEGHWGPFGGANDWPRKPDFVWRTDWRSSNDGQRIEYEKREAGASLHVVVEADGDEVRIHVRPRGCGAVHLGTICVKTFSPFFSSQERLTQHRLVGDELVRCADMPLPGRLSQSFGWSVGEDLPAGAVVTRSYDGRGWLALVGQPGADSWGNGWPHCTHLLGEAMTSEHGGELRLLFAIGDRNEVLSRIA